MRVFDFTGPSYLENLGVVLSGLKKIFEELYQEAKESPDPSANDDLSEYGEDLTGLALVALKTFRGRINQAVEMYTKDFSPRKDTENFTRLRYLCLLGDYWKHNSEWKVNPEEPFRAKPGHIKNGYEGLNRFLAENSKDEDNIDLFHTIDSGQNLIGAASIICGTETNLFDGIYAVAEGWLDEVLEDSVDKDLRDETG
jgi:hypothetical protein